MDKATIIKQDKKQDESVDITTSQTELGFVTTITIKSGDSTSIEEINTSNLGMAITEHDKAVSRLLKNHPKPDEELIRPEVGAKNPYLYGAADFTPMLPGIVE